MKLDPKQLRWGTPFWPAPFRRTLRFTGRRNSIQLQETALVAEGELLLFSCFGLERFFGRALSAWSTITIPYSRIQFLQYRSRIALRLVISAFLFLVMLLLMQPGSDPSELGWTEGILLSVFLLLGCIVWWRIPPVYSGQFGSKTGRRTRFQFSVRSRLVRLRFEAALEQYRAAALAYHNFTER